MSENNQNEPLGEPTTPITIRDFTIAEMEDSNERVINQLAHWTATRIQGETQENVLQFLGEAINNGIILPQDFYQIEADELMFPCVDKNFEELRELSSLYEEKVPQRWDRSLENDFDEGMENDLYPTVLTTQERVVIETATEFAKDYWENVPNEYTWVQSDVLNKIDPHGDLHNFYPIDYEFAPSESLHDKITLDLTRDELLIVLDACEYATLNWEQLPDSYRTILDGVVNMVEEFNFERPDEINLDLYRHELEFGEDKDEFGEDELDTEHTNVKIEVKNGTRTYFPTQEDLNTLEKEGYAEMPYTDISQSGIRFVGTEDFTSMRWNTMIQEGKKMPNLTVELTLQSLLEKMKENYTFANLVTKAVEITEIESIIANGSEKLFQNPPTLDDLELIHDFTEDIWINYENVEKKEIVKFICEAVDEGKIQISDLESLSQSEFFDALCDWDIDELGELLINEDLMLALEKESAVTSIAYQIGFQHVLVDSLNDGEVSVSLINQNFLPLICKEYHFPQDGESISSITLAINQFCKEVEFRGVEQLKNREVATISVDGVKETVDEYVLKRHASTELEQQFLGMADDSCAVYQLNMTERSDLIIGADLTLLLAMNEPLNKENYEVNYVSHLDGIVEQEHREECEIDEEFLAMFIENIQNDHKYDVDLGSKIQEFHQGDVFGIKQEGEVSYYFLTGKGLKEVDFKELRENVLDLQPETTVNFPFSKEPLVKVDRDELFQSVMGNSDTKGFYALHEENIACAKFLTNQLYDNYYDGKLNAKAVLENTVEKFGLEKTKLVVANSIQLKAHSDFVYPVTENWARTIEIPDNPTLNLEFATDKVGSLNDLVAELKEMEKQVEYTIVASKHDPVYYADSFVADKEGMVAEFLISHEENSLCANFLKNQLNEHYDGYSLDSPTILDNTVEKFGEERTKMVLAYNIGRFGSDGRIPHEVKDWAKGVAIPDDPQLNNQMLIENSGLLGIVAKKFMQIEQSQLEPQKLGEVEPRKVNEHYVITDSKIIGDTEIALGESRAGDVHGTWTRTISADESKGAGENWNFGHYFIDEKDKAFEDFEQRIKHHSPEKQSKKEKQPKQKVKEPKNKTKNTLKPENKKNPER